MQLDYDCVVIGAGLVGAAQALALRRLGLSVAVVESRRPFIAGTLGDTRGLALAPSSRNLFETLKLWPTLNTRVTRIRHIHVSDQGRFGATRLSADDVGIEALGYVCPADHLLATLESALIADAKVYWETSLENVSTSGTAAKVSLRHALGDTEILTRLLIGADGPHSKLRNLVGITSRNRDYRQSAIVANLDVQYPELETAFERFTRSGPLALLPLDQGRHVAVRCCANSEVESWLAIGDEEFLAELEIGFGHRFGSFSHLSQRSAHDLSLNWASEIVADRIALVGAAANSIHPNGAQGLNLGLRDVSGLANAIEQALERNADIGGSECLRAFSDRRRSDQRAVVRFTDSIAQLFATSLPPIGILRNLAMFALEVTPAAKRCLIRRATGAFDEPLSIPSRL
ncbi:MAG: FAD-dependent monooxygenase [Proteobacteria bacterium]|nr:FAD-dependent monooxygenase [Pseudomonadota bacterium]